MSAPLVCLLLLSCALTGSRAGVVLENGAPLMWGHTTVLLTDFSNVDGVMAPDPWNYLERMSLYRLILAATDNYMTSMGSGENESPIWGLPLQLSWMLSSGRLADPTGTTTCGFPSEDSTLSMCISPRSWWGCVNYYSSVLPFLSVAQSGLFGEAIAVQMKTADGAEGYCTTYESCKQVHADAMNNWDAFYQGLKDSVASPMAQVEIKDALLGLYWSAQTASIKASSVCNDKITPYSSVEKAFAESWLNAGEYVAAVFFKSNLTLAAEFMTPLPGRVLKEEDSPPNIPDLSAEENHSLHIFSWMKSADRFLGGTLVGMWRSAMCSVTTREKGREMLTELLFNPQYATTSFLTIVTSMSTGCS